MRSADKRRSHGTQFARDMENMEVASKAAELGTFGT
jgi:hypothetical protein